MRKIITALLLMSGGVFNATADTKELPLTVTGEVYRECSLSSQSLSIDIGRVRAGNWVAGQYYLQNQSGRKFVDFSLTDCDPGTTIKISAQANEHVTGGDATETRWYIGNQRGSNRNIAVGLGIRYPGMTEGVEILWTDNSHARTYTTTANGNQTIQFSADLVRIDKTLDSVGTFDGGATIYFTFE